jgi:hypothetical protein
MPLREQLSARSPRTRYPTLRHLLKDRPASHAQRAHPLHHIRSGLVPIKTKEEKHNAIATTPGIQATHQHGLWVHVLTTFLA